MGYKLLLLQWIESIHDIKKIKPVQTDTWNYNKFHQLLASCLIGEYEFCKKIWLIVSITLSITQLMATDEIGHLWESL